VIFPKDRIKYVQNVYNILKPQGRYLSVCFSENDSHFGGQGKQRKRPIGTVLYFSSEDELEILFRQYFDISELKTIQIEGKLAPHFAVCVLMTKR
jgi:hypothetical protein